MALTLIKCHPFNARHLLLADVRPIIPPKNRKRSCSLKGMKIILKYELYCKKRVLSLTHMLIFMCMLSTHGMHGLRTCTLHNNKTLEPLIWNRVCPSHFWEHTLKCSHVLYCLYLTSVNLQHSN